ncbi:hypothetical protein WA171_006556 [Blastocystis sp. BT1]
MQSTQNENPYSRLLALQRMGVVQNYESIRSKTVLIVGIGGVGSVTAEMLSRCGIGKMILFDYDTVETANMNRLFYLPSQCGLSKVVAAKATLQTINPDVQYACFNCDITSLDGYDLLSSCISTGSLSNGQVDLVLSCVDNYSARMTINSICTHLNQVWMESGVSEDALSGHIQLMLPGRTACFQCLPPLAVASGIDEKTIRRDGVCAASLPTTIGIIAGLLSHNALKYLLAFGQISYYQGFMSQTNFFPSTILYPNPECPNPDCHRLQQVFRRKWKPEEWKPVIIPVSEDENEWGITIEESGFTEKCSQIQNPNLQNQSVEDLMDEFKHLME